jgi:CHAD domain-containing protein
MCAQRPPSSASRGPGVWRPDAAEAHGEAVFSLGRGNAQRTLVAFLREHASLKALPRESRQLVYYDTFDWRLHRSGLRLSSHDEDGDTLLWLGPAFSPGGSPAAGEVGQGDSEGRNSRTPRSGGDGDAPTFLRVDKIPSFATDLPRSRLRRRLRRVVDVRRLLPTVRVELARRCYRVLDDEQKTVVKLYFEWATARDPATPEHVRELSGTLRVEPVAGYRKAHAAILARLQERPGIEAVAGDLAARALEAVGRVVVAPTSGLRCRLDAAAPAGSAFLALHRELFATLRDNEQGIRDDLDTEHLHDFRVGVRRTRVLHRIFRAVLAGSEFDALVPGFKWLGRVTNPTRDLDVHLIDLYEQRASLPEEHDALLPLEALLRERRRYEWEKLVEALDSVAWADLEASTAALLDPPPSDAARRISAGGPTLGPWASRRIAKGWRRMVKHGRRVGTDTPDEWLHDVRLDGKRLRYLLEFFRSLYPADRIDPLVKELKRLQDNLGEFNDACVQSETLRSLARDLAARGTNGDALVAIGRLVERAEQRAQAERDRFHKRFRRFNSRANRKRFRRLFEIGERRSTAPEAAPRPSGSQEARDGDA